MEERSRRTKGPLVNKFNKGRGGEKESCSGSHPTRKKRGKKTAKTEKGAKQSALYTTVLGETLVGQKGLESPPGPN